LAAVEKRAALKASIYKFRSKESDELASFVRGGMPHSESFLRCGQPGDGQYKYDRFVARRRRMNCLMATPDRSTHLKIVVVAFLCSTTFLLTTN
jgi:hypothetical protein